MSIPSDEITPEMIQRTLKTADIMVTLIEHAHAGNTDAISGILDQIDNPHPLIVGLVGMATSAIGIMAEEGGATFNEALNAMLEGMLQGIDEAISPRAE